VTEPADEDEPPQCAACHRALKHPSPSGYGPVCERKLHGRPARRPRTTSPAAKPGLSQTELPLTDQLELDWST
jgi:hypothetical protein